MGKLHEVFHLFDGRAYFYLREPTHEPPHVHVYGHDDRHRAVFEYENGVWALRHSKGFSKAELAVFARYLQYENRTKPILARFQELKGSAGPSEK
jgi:hypothetical protein